MRTSPRFAAVRASLRRSSHRRPPGQNQTQAMLPRRLETLLSRWPRPQNKCHCRTVAVNRPRQLCPSLRSHPQGPLREDPETMCCTTVNLRTGRPLQRLPLRSKRWKPSVGAGRCLSTTRPPLLLLRLSSLWLVRRVRPAMTAVLASLPSQRCPRFSRRLPMQRHRCLALPFRTRMMLARPSTQMRQLLPSLHRMQDRKSASPPLKPPRLPPLASAVQTTMTTMDPLALSSVSQAQMMRAMSTPVP